MKKVKYIGELEVLLPDQHVVVKKGDVIEVSDDFENALFVAVEDKNTKNKEENK